MQVVSLPFTFTLPSASLSASPSPSKIPLTLQEIFGEFEEPGLIDRYESVIASVGYEHIEALVLNMHGPVGKHDVGCVEVVDVGRGGSVDVGYLC